MDRIAAASLLKAHERELRMMGLTELSLFGSVARGDARLDSDIDLAARFDQDKIDLLDFAKINLRLMAILGSRVDLVSEPTQRAPIQAAIDRDRVRVF